MSKKKFWTIIIIFLMIVFLLILLVIGINKKNNEDFRNKIKDVAINSNVLIIFRGWKDEASTTSIVLHKGSGVIIEKDKDKYFVLTAYHTISYLDYDRIDVKIIHYDEDDFDSNKHGYYWNDFYDTLPNVNIEYYNESYDLALLSFHSEKSYEFLKVSNNLPNYGTKVAAIGNPLGKNRNTITTGKITSKKPAKSKEDGNSITVKTEVIYHSAKINVGNSGGALLNKKLEIVGINLFREDNVFGDFRFTGAIACDKIQEFLNNKE